MSYYVFTVITPPNSDMIGLEFIKEAIRLDPEEKEYKDWLEIVEKGN